MAWAFSVGIFQEVDAELAGQAAHLAGRDLDAPACPEVLADFLALAEVEETLDADLGQDVVADGAAGQKQGCRVGGPADQGPATPAVGRRLGAPIGAHVLRFPYPERPVGEGAATVLERLAHMHRAPALRTPLSAGLDAHGHLADVAQLRLPLVPGFPEGASHRGERVERDRAVFFPTA